MVAITGLSPPLISAPLLLCVQQQVPAGRTGGFTGSMAQPRRQEEELRAELWCSFGALVLLYGLLNDQADPASISN